MIREGNPLVATAYMCRSSDNLACMAQILGYDEDYSKYEKIANRIRRTYEKYLIAEDGTIQPGHQAAYVRALAIDLFSIGNTGKREAVTNQLIKEIEKNNYCLNTGFLSTPYLLPILSDIGREDLAYRLLEQTDNPSWLHPITLGSTTILESWDGRINMKVHIIITVTDLCVTFSSHILLASDRASIHQVTKEFDLKPVIGGSLTYAEASYESIYGLIVSGWQKNSNLINYYCQIPPCTRAHLILPNGEIHQLGSGYYNFTITL
jgi:alpha-L-rhamnosidase